MTRSYQRRCRGGAATTSGSPPANPNTPIRVKMAACLERGAVEFTRAFAFEANRKRNRVQHALASPISRAPCLRPDAWACPCSRQLMPPLPSVPHVPTFRMSPPHSSGPLPGAPPAAGPSWASAVSRPLITCRCCCSHAPPPPVARAHRLSQPRSCGTRGSAPPGCMGPRTQRML
jgi:hypothetical protein